ncbi:antiterminator LoaP [Brevibacillus humidisoli]|uniref:antiterminator LoaP n=1 Tax=Brevibacillus humidisoli TaxID=2895522 RepID=UPI001E29FD31|nr:antiterminator LoaP [Brevibacillus humidisoli]UFJ41780.1 antiterminator LoaP [Brevibacillus humidisoli]
MDWYALFVQTGKEETVQKLLRLHFDEPSLYSIVPKRRLPERKAGRVHHVARKMFPGYVLIKTNMNPAVFYKIRKLPKVYYVVHNQAYSHTSETYYRKIDEQEMATILQLLGDGEIVDYSRVYLEKSQVIITSGPLQGLEGIINKVDKRKNRANILVNFMGKEKHIDVGIEILSKTN